MGCPLRIPAQSGYTTSVPKYSIVVPFHNEQESVTELYDRLKAVMEQVGEAFELVFVDDGSRECHLHFAQPDCRRR